MRQCIIFSTDISYRWNVDRVLHFFWLQYSRRSQNILFHGEEPRNATFRHSIDRTLLSIPFPEVLSPLGRVVLLGIPLVCIPTLFVRNRVLRVQECGATHPFRGERLSKSSSYTTSWTAVLTAYTVNHSSHPSSVSVI